MKKLSIFSPLLTLLSVVSCGFDNYSKPNATLEGALIDVETKEKVQSDIINGFYLELIETGFKNPPIQKQVIRPDGSFCNKLMFMGEYIVLPRQNGNFVPQMDTLDLRIEKNSKLNLEVLPYARIIEPEITVEGATVSAKFKVQQPYKEGKIKTIALFADKHIYVGENLRYAKVSKDINVKADGIQVYELTMTLAGNNNFKPGKNYYFRIGALVDIPSAKYNYSAAVRLQLPGGNAE